MTPVQQAIHSLESEPEKWTQGDHTLRHENGVEIWTTNLPYFNTCIYRPKRKTGFIEGFRLQLAINKWSKQPILM